MASMQERLSAAKKLAESRDLNKTAPTTGSTTRGRLERAMELAKSRDANVVTNSATNSITPVEPTVIDRAKNIVSGGAKQYGSGFVSALGTYLEGSQKSTTREMERKYKAKQAVYEKMKADNQVQPGRWSAQIMEAYQRDLFDMANMLHSGKEAIAESGLVKAGQSVQKVAGKLSQSGAADLEKAKQGLGTLGKFAVDVGVAGGQMAADIGIGVVTGGGALVPMAVRGFGSGAQEARKQGADTDEQFLYGAAGAATSVLVERLSNLSTPFVKAFGKGAADDILKNAISKAATTLSKSTGGQKALTALMKTGVSAFGEGAEEFLESAVDPILRRATFDPHAQFQAEEAMYNFLIGGALGAVGGGMETVTNLRKTEQTPQIAEQNAQSAGNPLSQPAADSVPPPSVAEGDISPRQGESAPARGEPDAQETEQTAQEAAQQLRERVRREQRLANATSELERTGIMASADDETIAQAQRIAQAVGREIVFFREEATQAGIRNGYYSAQDGKIHINAASQNPTVQIIAHELTHGVELADAYGRLSRLVLDRIQKTGGNLAQMRTQTAELYRQNGVELSAQEDIDREIVAEYVEKNLLTNEASIRELVNSDPSLGRRILDWLNSILAKLGNKGAQEREFILQAREAYAKALGQAKEIQIRSQSQQEMDWARGEYAAGNITEEEFDAATEDMMEAESEMGASVLERNSFSGARAMRANHAAREEAERLEMQGVDSETIRKETGWFRGADRKWRWEIDDSGMEYDKDGNMEGAVTRQWAMEDVDNAWADMVDAITPEQLERVREYLRATLDHNWELADRLYQPLAKELGQPFTSWVEAREWAMQNRDKSTGGKLSDYIQHPELFANYPQLRNVKLRFEPMAYANGYYSPSTDEIVLNEAIKDHGEETLIHEVQHVIQHIEGFATGANPEYWKRVQDGDNPVRSNDRKIAEARARIEQTLSTLPEDMAEQFRQFTQTEKTDEAAAVDMAEQLGEGPYGEQFNQYFMDTWALDELEKYNHRRGANDLYRNTAGEIEARDTASRLRHSKEGREWLAHYTGDENTVFADRETDSEDYIPGDISTEETKAGIRAVAGMEPVAAITGAEFQKGEKDLTTQAAEFFDSIGNQVFNPQLGDVTLDRRGAKDDIAHGIGKKKAAAFAAVPDVLEKGRVIDFQKDWKGRGYDTAVVAAPITIGGVKHYAGVVLLRSRDTNRFYVHEVLTTENGASPFKTGASSKRGLPGGDAPSVISLLRQVRDVNTEDAGTPEGLSLPRPEPTSGSKKQYSVSQPEGLSLPTPGEDTRKNRSEAEYQAAAQGYPILNGRQVVPMRTWVHATDVLKDSKGNVIMGEDGQPVRRDNYGLVVGIGGKDGTLRVAFHNKNIQSGVTGEEARATVDIAYSDLEPAVSSARAEDEMLTALMDSEPEDISKTELTAEQQADLDEIFARSFPSKTTRAEAFTPVEIDSLPTKAQNYLKGVERKLLAKVSDLLSVPRAAQRDFLQDVVRKISEEYLTQGRVSKETTDNLFEQAYEQGVVVEREFYENYKDVKDFLRSTAINVGEELRGDIADFNDWRCSAFGSLRLVDEGGRGVDSVYRQAQELAHELFPDTIINPADQLVHMYEVSKSIVKTERTLNEVYGPGAEEFKRYTKHDFEAAIGDVLGELRAVKRYNDERAQKTQEDDQALQMTEEDVAALYEQMKHARKTYEKAAAKNLLTDHDEVQVGRLLRGELELEHLEPDKDNVKGITAVFESKREYDRLAAQIRTWNRARKAKLRATADEYLKTANDWKDKKAGILYSAETMERNVRDIVKDKELARQINDEYFRPVHDAQAASTRMKNRYRERVRQLGLSRKIAKGNVVSEAHAVQLLGEAEDNIRVLERSRGRTKTRDGKTLEDWRGIVANLWQENPGLDQAKIRDAVKEFRAIYDELFAEMNRSRIHNGYEPVNYRSGYFPHFQPGEGDGILAQFGKALGVDMGVTALPTTINGLTHTFKPGIRWFGNAMERIGFNTAYDAVEGFDRYIEGVSDVVYQTENIQKLRALASQARYRTSDEGLRQQVDEVKQRTDLSDIDKQNRIDKIYENGRFALGNFVVELDEYTNLLANKKSRADRDMEQALGRRMYNLVKTLESRVAANMVAVNPASWLTNFIPITQGAATLDSRALLRGMWGTLQAYKEDDGIVGRSSFLTNRRGSDPLVRTWAQAASAKLSSPMELIDSFTADTLVRARYQQNLSKGMSEESALAEADSWAAGVMADRSKGSTPTLFNRSNPVTKLFTQFQLEVNNQLRYLFKDLPNDIKDKGAAALATALLKFFLGAFLYNEAYEYFIGRRPALDPIGILLDTVEDIQDGKGTYEVVSGFAGNVAEELPFIGGILGGGRVPISSALPDWENLGKAAFNEKWSGKKKAATAVKELANPVTYLALPFGGGQIKKILQGLKAVARGGSYSVDSEGNDILQYPVYRDTAGQAVLSATGAMLFGKASLPTGREWVESGFKSLGAKETAAYRGMMDAGVAGEEAFGLIQELRSAQKTETASVDDIKRGILRDSEVSGAGKLVVYYGLLASDKEQIALDDLESGGMDPGEMVELMLDIKAADKQNDKLKVVGDAALTEREARTAAGMILGTDLVNDEGKTTTYGKLVEALDSGIGMKRYVELKTAGVVDKYLENVEAGVDADTAADIVLRIAQIRGNAKEADEDVSSLELYRAAVEVADSEDEQLAALQGLMTDSEYAKLTAGRELGVTPEQYVEIKERLAKIDDNGNVSQAEATQAIARMTGLTVNQKAALWQMQNKGWGWKNNPFSTRVGQRVKDALEAQDDEEEQEDVPGWVSLPKPGE